MRFGESTIKWRKFEKIDNISHQQHDGILNFHSLLSPVGPRDWFYSDHFLQHWAPISLRRLQTRKTRFLRFPPTTPLPVMELSLICFIQGGEIYFIHICYSYLVPEAIGPVAQLVEFGKFYWCDLLTKQKYYIIGEDTQCIIFYLRCEYHGLITLLSIVRIFLPSATYTLHIVTHS